MPQPSPFDHTPTGTQIRGARGLLDWPLHRLAEASGVSVSTIKRIEEGHEGSPRPVKVAAIRDALQRSGIRFVTVAGDPGVVRAASAPQLQAAE